jgi:hypothetical protein
LWLLAIGGLVVMLPLCCCGGMLVYASSFKDFTLRNGEHLGGSPLNVRFDFEMHTDRPTFVAFFIVGRTADGTTRERNLSGWLNKRGSLHFSAFDVPAREGQFPVQVWIEKEGRDGHRSRASNTISIRAKR